MSSSDEPEWAATPDDPDATPRGPAVLERLTDRRRAVLARLLDAGGDCRERTLAATLAAEGADDSPRTAPDAAVDGAVAQLQQVHLPVLEAVGLLAHDADEGTVAATDHRRYDDPRFRRFLESDAALDGLVDALADERRRQVYAILEARDEPIGRADLASEAAASLSLSAASFRLQLHHVHLPMLEGEGLLAYDADEGVVAPAQPDVDRWLLALLTGR